MSLNPFLALGSFLICILLGQVVSAEEINIYFKSSPLPERLRPFSEPAAFSLLATSANGKPLEGGWVNVRLEAPKSGFFSTDYPVVEGTDLIEVRLPLQAGKVEWKYSLPIRGQYRMSVEVLAQDGTRASKTFEFGIREHRAKWLMLGLFILALFGLGFIAGRIFTSRQTAVATILLTAAVSGCSAVVVGAQEAKKPPVQLEIDAPSVGKLSGMRWSMETKAGKETALLSLTITHIEKGATIFAVESIPVDGEYSMNFQFADGANHRVMAVAELPGGQSIRTEQIVSVSSVEPPISTMIPAMALFLGAIAAGLAVGRWSRCNAAPS